MHDPENDESRAVLLKPCPFCGKEAERKKIKSDRKIRGIQYQLAFVGCSRCTAEVRAAGPTSDKAWEYAESVWNKREDRPDVKSRQHHDGKLEGVLSELGYQIKE